MAKVDARCCICGSKEFGDPEKNNNYYSYTVKEDDLNFGGGKQHGTEILPCPTCEEETVHNRAASSVPKEGMKDNY